MNCEMILYDGPLAGRKYNTKVPDKFKGDLIYIPLIMDGKYYNAIYNINDWSEDKKVLFYYFNKLSFLGNCEEGEQDGFDSSSDLFDS